LDNPLLIAPGFFAIMLLSLGLVIGSFLNVVIARVPEGLSVVKPRSRCPKCGHEITWYENIPVLSWVFLRGKCSGCKTPISIRYPLVELLTGALFMACLRKFGWAYELVPALVMVTLLIPLTFIDLEHWILPFELTLPGIALGVLTAIPLGVPRLIDAAIGTVVGFGAFWLMEKIGEAIFKKEALGGGDKYLLAMLGGFLGWRALLLIIFLSSFQGALVGATLLVVHGRAHLDPNGEPPDEDGAPKDAPAASGPKPEEPLASGPAPAEAKPAEPGVPPTAVVSPAPDAPPPGAIEPAKSAESGEEEDDWVPGKTALPFGPWLAIAGLEVLLFGDWMAAQLPANLAVVLGLR